ncbi:hypothetical protein TNCV_3762731 [Trichonephila clavipes]|nr:hypothetical protein TNCV_3762731 [Trichonephila clavipes]
MVMTNNNSTWRCKTHLVEWTKDCWIRSSKSGVLALSAEPTTIRTLKLLATSGEKPKELRSWERGSRATVPPLPI